MVDIVVSVDGDWIPFICSFGSFQVLVCLVYAFLTYDIGVPFLAR